MKGANSKISDKSLKGTLEKGDMLIIVSPLGWITAPFWGIHLLQAACRCARITTSALYSNLSYSNLIGANLHSAITRDDYSFLGERLFASAAFDLPPMGHRLHKYFEPGWIPDHKWPRKKETHEELIGEVFSSFRGRFRNIDWGHLEIQTRQWTRSLAQQIAEMGYSIVGCSTTHGGLAPAISLLRWVKKADPNIITILGGALCQGEMAEGILSLKSNIDYIFSGEGEITFPVLAKEILAGDLPADKIIYGELITNLETTPLPTYDEYFLQKKHFCPTTSSTGSSIHIPYEISRGCWFARCTFCGLMGEKNIYRKKSPDHIIKELKLLVSRYGITYVFFTDNILPAMYPKTLFPRLAAKIPSLRLFLDIKANLTLSQLLALQKAGAIFIQAGIESLAPSLLRRMDKGVTVRENIALLRYARSINLDLKWNLLFGFPGDQISEYEEMLHLLPLIRHLQPPVQMKSLRLCRFSKYHTSAKLYGVTNLQPAEVFKDTLPSHADLDKIAFIFSADFQAQSQKEPGIITALWNEYREWSNQWVAYTILPLNFLLPTLHLSRKSPDRFVLQDTRGIPGRAEKLFLDRKQASLILVARPWHDSPEFQWALDAKLGVVLDSWFIPLATAEPELLQEFELAYEQAS